MEENIKVENVEKKSFVRVGRNTFGVTLILFGICVILQMFLPFEILRYVFMLWPLIFISLGIEILYYNKRQENIKYDILGTILIFIILGIGSVMAFVNFGINQVLYNDEIKEEIIYHSVNDEYTKVIGESQKLKIINLTEKPVNLKINEVQDIDCIYINGKLKITDTSKIDVISSIVDRYNVHDIIHFNKLKEGNSSIIIDNNKDYVDSVDIVITLPSKENVSYSGNIEVK